MLYKGCVIEHLACVLDKNKHLPYTMKNFPAKPLRLLKEKPSRKRSALLRKINSNAEVAVLSSGKRKLHHDRVEVLIIGSNQNSSFANGQKILREIGTFDMRKAAIDAGVITKTGELTKSYS